ncbi:Hint domain-containing protein [Methylobacterium sp. BTF04]|uniref:Hint domain-containing protein n=1 Tax=Methylobacterium sp. BTF04 TaxID=2708300 RepID=UPI001FED91D0|nr:Hint domain-containing protein [Methylobacterium sp. BTF04]
MTDVPDAGKADALTQLGDVTRDAFTGNNGTRDFSRTYVGETSDKLNVVFVSNSARPTYFIYSNNSYLAGSTVTIDRSAFALCFGSGTLIATARGQVAVEDLRIGDLAVTASGAQRPITWIGHRHLEGKALDADKYPVRVRANAFGHGLPARDLTLSPGHPVLVGADADAGGGVLVPVMSLINGTTIDRVAPEAVTYWHIELDSHDILLAEGLPAESFLDFGCRAFFDEASDHALHNPDFVVPGLSARCRPVAVDGPLVEAERARLDAVFSAALAAQCAWIDTDTLSNLAA